MEYSPNHAGQLCAICEKPIHGEGLIAAHYSGVGCTSYHLNCYEQAHMEMYARIAELEATRFERPTTCSEAYYKLLKASSQK